MLRGERATWSDCRQQKLEAVVVNLPNGMEDRANSHRQPMLFNTSHARPASRQLPKVQNACSVQKTLFLLTAFAPASLILTLSRLYSTIPFATVWTCPKLTVGTLRLLLCSGAE